MRIAAADPMGASIYSWIKTGELKAEGSSITEGIGQGRVTANLEGAPIDDAYQIPDEEALPIVFDLLEHEGLCMGGSTGINVAGAIRMAEELGPGHTIVTILCDYGTRYQSKLFNPEFLASKGLPVPRWLAEKRPADRRTLRKMSDTPPLVSTDWLAARLDAPDIRVVDASWYLPQAGRDAKAEYAAVHIPRAVFFDIDDFSDDRSSLPHMLAPAPKFMSRMRKLGLGDGHLIVVYDGAGVYSAPRAWWMLRAMGHEDVTVLDGGLPKWRREGRPVEDMEPTTVAASFHGGDEPRASSATSPICRPRCSSARRNSSTRGAPRASPGARRSRAQACAPVTCRAPSTFRTRS